MFVGKQYIYITFADVNNKQTIKIQDYEKGFI